jgi:hypothetical protein
VFASIIINPATGGRGTVITVTGSGWLPVFRVTVTYGDGQGADATATVRPDSTGAFTTHVTAREPFGALPASVTVNAHNNRGQSADATFQYNGT